MAKQKGPPTSRPAIISSADAMAGAYAMLKDEAVDLATSVPGHQSKSSLRQWEPAPTHLSYVVAALEALRHCSRAHWSTVKEFEQAASEVPVTWR